MAAAAAAALLLSLSPLSLQGGAGTAGGAASRIDAACACSDVDALRTTLREHMQSFGRVRPPLSRSAVSLDSFEGLTGLSPACCAPREGRGWGGLSTASFSSNLGAAAAVVGAQMLLAELAVGGGPLPALRLLEWWQLPAVLLGTAGGMVLALALVDRLLLGGALLVLLSTSLRTDAYIRHEAGHTLLALLLGCPVQQVVVSPLAALADPRLRGSPGTVFYAPALEAARARCDASDADVDVASIVLMGGIAAEALEYGHAEGGASDEADLRELIEAQQLPQLAPALHARWAAANAILLLRSHREAFDEVCDVLRAGGSVGECCVRIDAQLARAGDAGGERTCATDWQGEQGSEHNTKRHAELLAVDAES